MKCGKRDCQFISYGPLEMDAWFCVDLCFAKTSSSSSGQLIRVRLGGEDGLDVDDGVRGALEGEPREAARRP
jgi:hypothetical protein